MTKRLVDIDDRLLRAASRRMRTRTIKDTVNAALREAAGAEALAVDDALDVLGAVEWATREDAWR